MHRTLGVQEEKGSLLCPPEQNLVHRERKNGRATFKGALSTAPGHKEGTQQTWVLYPSSQLNCLEVFKQTKKKKKKAALCFQPSQSSPHVLLTPRPTAARLLPAVSSPGHRWPSNRDVLPRHGTIPQSSPQPCMSSYQNLCPRGFCGLSYVFPLLSWLFGWLLLRPCFWKLLGALPFSTRVLPKAHSRTTLSADTSRWEPTFTHWAQITLLHSRSLFPTCQQAFPLTWSEQSQTQQVSY